MVSNVLGMMIGAEIDHDEGGSGIGRALEGYLIEDAVGAIAPLVMTFAISWGVGRVRAPEVQRFRLTDL